MMRLASAMLLADKKQIVAANMGLTETEGKGFWPLYSVDQQ